jgi:competence protein ComEC
VVPLSSLIIYTGIVVLSVGYFPVVAAVCAKVFVFLIWLLNSIIHFIEQLPWSTIQGVFISKPEMIILYIFIAAFFFFLTLRRVRFLYVSLLSAILLGLLSVDFKIDRLTSSEIIVFNASHKAIYMFSSQDKAILLYNGSSQDGRFYQELKNRMVVSAMHADGILTHRDFWFQPGRRYADVVKNFIPLRTFGNFIQFGKTRIALLSSPVPKGFNHRIDVDILILTCSPRMKIDDAIRIYHPSQIIIDATNPRFRTLQWIRDALRSGVRCHAVAEHGAFQKEY